MCIYEKKNCMCIQLYTSSRPKSSGVGHSEASPRGGVKTEVPPPPCALYPRMTYLHMFAQTLGQAINDLCK